jgi:hypothetical protein
MIKALLIARLIAAALGRPDDSIVCYHIPSTTGNACYVEIADTGYITSGIETTVDSTGKVSQSVVVWEY